MNRPQAAGYGSSNAPDSNNSQYVSDNSNNSNNANNGITIRKHKKRISNSEEKPISSNTNTNYKTTIVTDVTDQVTTNPVSNVNIIEDYGAKKDEKIVAQPQNIPNPKLKQIQKLQDSLITVSSPSRGSVLTNPQAPG